MRYTGVSIVSGEPMRGEREGLTSPMGGRDVRLLRLSSGRVSAVYDDTVRPVPPGSLTESDVLSLARIVKRAHAGGHVTRVVDGVEFVGVARHIVASVDDSRFPSGQHDIRECALRVTLNSGSDVAWPVGELIADMQGGLFFPEYPHPYPG